MGGKALQRKLVHSVVCVDNYGFKSFVPLQKVTDIARVLKYKTSLNINL